MFWIKIGVSAVVIALVSEIAKRQPTMAAIIASLPLVSILSMIWIYIETSDTKKVIELNQGMIFFVAPTLVFFIIFPMFLKWGWNFWAALMVSMCFLAAIYPLCLKSFKSLGWI